MGLANTCSLKTQALAFLIEETIPLINEIKEENLKHITGE